MAATKKNAGGRKTASKRNLAKAVRFAGEPSAAARQAVSGRIGGSGSQDGASVCFQLCSPGHCDCICECGGICNCNCACGVCSQCACACDCKCACDCACSSCDCACSSCDCDCKTGDFSKILQEIESRLAVVEKQGQIIGSRMTTIGTIVQSRFGDINRILDQLQKNVGRGK